MSMWDDLLEIMLLLLVVSVVALTPIIGLAYWLESKSCSNYSEITGYESKFDFFAGCFVERDGEWHKKGELRKDKGE